MKRAAWSIILSAGLGLTLVLGGAQWGPPSTAISEDWDGGAMGGAATETARDFFPPAASDWTTDPERLDGAIPQPDSDTWS